MAWSRIGRYACPPFSYSHEAVLIPYLASVVDEDQLNLVLVKLVEYLGHSTAITSATAFAEVRFLLNGEEYDILKSFRS